MLNQAGRDHLASLVHISVHRTVDVLVVEKIEAVAVDFRPGAEVPLADLARNVADLFEVLGDGEFPVETTEVAVVGFDAEAVLILTDQ